MRIKLAGALCGALLGITVPAMAEDAPRSYEASPDIYKVIAQNGPIHVIMATWKPGQRDAWHSHPAAGVYFLTDCQSYVYLPNGTSLCFCSQGRRGDSEPSHRLALR